jgi:hypothetical protein
MGGTAVQSQQAVTVPALNLLGKIIQKIFKNPLQLGVYLIFSPLRFARKG